MKKVIVTTTINAPTEAIEKFDAMPGWDLIAIGDRKTPADYKLKGGLYVSPEDQESYDKRLSDAIGWNCIQRRNIGLLMAREYGADVIAMVDDDNIPLPGWGENLMLGKETETNFYEIELPAFDPIGATNYPWLWHRGYPLQLIRQREYNRVRSRKSITPHIQADFWNGDPDIDAFCRLELAPNCSFDPYFFPIASNKMSPFNSQNTFMLGSMLRDYFLWPGIGRMDDIWASYYLQARGRQVIYGKPSVYQKRNEHDLIADMKAEYLGYENNLAIVNGLARDAVSMLGYLPGRAIEAWELYQRHFGLKSRTGS